MPNEKKKINVKCVNGRNKTLHIKISRVNTENKYKKYLKKKKITYAMLAKSKTKNKSNLY